MDNFEIVKEWDEGPVHFALAVAPDDQPVRGNAMASGDDAADREVEDAILERLDGGDWWAWACVRVTASAGGLEGTDYLGGCSYEDAEDFERDGYFADMVFAARADLRGQLREAAETYGILLLAEAPEVSR